MFWGDSGSAIGLKGHGIGRCHRVVQAISKSPGATRRSSFCTSQSQKERAYVRRDGVGKEEELKGPGLDKHIEGRGGREGHF